MHAKAKGKPTREPGPAVHPTDPRVAEQSRQQGSHPLGSSMERLYILSYSSRDLIHASSHTDSYTPLSMRGGACREQVAVTGQLRVPCCRRILGLRGVS
jgi:hypothetical protein